MTYSYDDMKQNLFSDEGQRMFLAIRDRFQSLTSATGACTVAHVIKKQSGDSFLMLACCDRLVELGEAEYLNTSRSFQERVLIRVGGAN